MKTFLWSPRRKIGDFRKNLYECVAVSMKTVCEDPTVRVRDKQAVWKLLSEISRTTPDLKIFLFLRGMLQTTLV